MKLLTMALLTLIICVPFLSLMPATAQEGCAFPGYFDQVGEVHIRSFLFGNECGAINLEQPYELVVSEDLRIYSRYGRVGEDTNAVPASYQFTPVPNLGVDWTPTNQAFEVFGDTIDEMVISQTTSSNLIIGLGHTYYDPTNERRLGLDWLRLIPTGLRMSGDTLEDLWGKTITLTQERGEWRTTLTLELTAWDVISTETFNQAGSFVNPVNQAIAFDPTLLGLEIPEQPTLVLVGCTDARYGDEVDWWGNRLMVSFTIQSITVEHIN